jgi:hypothetical protein
MVMPTLTFSAFHVVSLIAYSLSINVSHLIISPLFEYRLYNLSSISENPWPIASIKYHHEATLQQKCHQ